MHSFQLFSPLSLKERAAGAFVGLVSGLAVFAAVVLVFASASGEPETELAALKPAPSASAAAVRPASQAARG